MVRKLLAVFLIMFLLSGCGNNQPMERINSNKNHVKLVITHNFGQEKILTREIDYKKNLTVMDILYEADLKIEAGYGGSFVDGINGVISQRSGPGGERKDWFYFVNGIFADVGALDYFPQPGDVIWWDYRPWRMTGGTSTAVIGSFPETFQYSYLGKESTTYIMAYPQDKEHAQNLQNLLTRVGVNSVEIKEVNTQAIETPLGPTILLGQWDLIKEIDYINRLNQNYARAGVFGFFTQDTLKLLDHNITPVKEVNAKAGLIMATGQGSGDSSPLWIVTGIDQEGFIKGLEVLINDYEKLFCLYNAAVINGEVIGLPLPNNN